MRTPDENLVNKQSRSLSSVLVIVIFVCANRNRATLDQPRAGREALTNQGERASTSTYFVCVFVCVCKCSVPIEDIQGERQERIIRSRQPHGTGE